EGCRWGLLRAAIRDGCGGGAEGAGYSRANTKRAAGCRSKERAFRQRLGSRLQRRSAARRLQGDKSQRSRALLLRREFRRLEKLFLDKRSFSRVVCRFDIRHSDFVIHVT